MRTALRTVREPCFPPSGGKQERPSYLARVTKLVGNPLARARAKGFISSVVNEGCRAGEGMGRGGETCRTGRSSRRGAYLNPEATGPKGQALPDPRDVTPPAMRAGANQPAQLRDMPVSLVASLPAPWAGSRVTQA